MQNSISDPGRDHQFDNIRLILIFFVIFGHLIEYFSAGGILYRWIYSFHMPVFIFVSGYFAKFDPKKIVCNILVPYVLLQILYTAFDRLLYGNAPFRLQFTTPYWLLWYLLSLFCYYLLLPLIDTDRAAVQLFVFLACVALALLSGFGQGFGYFLSLSRTFVFLPFFVGGFYLKKHGTWLTAIRRGGVAFIGPGVRRTRRRALCVRSRRHDRQRNAVRQLFVFRGIHGRRPRAARGDGVSLGVLFSARRPAGEDPLAFCVRREHPSDLFAAWLFCAPGGGIRPVCLS